MAKELKKKCEELIEEKLKDRIKDFKEALKKSKESETFEIDGNEYEGFVDWLNNYALAYNDDTHYRAKRLELSYGGPQDYFLFFEDGEMISYHYLDWFDGAERGLFGGDLEIMQEVRDMLEV